MIAKRFAIALALALAALLAVLVFNMVTAGSPRAPKAATIANERIDQAGAARRLAAAVRIPTVSHGAARPVEAAALQNLHALLQASFPRVHNILKRETVNKFSLLYTWQGTNPSLKPALFSAHMDVAPVEPGTEKDWTHPPFAGAIEGGFVWGRGTMDMKGAMMGVLEAVEHLLAGDFKPKRSVYLAIGHDEEIGGTRGAAKIGEQLRERGVRLAFTLDEGLVVTEGILPGVEKPVALIGIAEKGIVTLKLSTRGPGGHGSMPPSGSAIAKLSQALARLEVNPMPAALRRPVTDMFDHVVAEMPFMSRLVFANRWLFEPIILSRLTQRPATNALVRTTTAVTIIKGGVKPNVIPQRAEATINVRMLPGDTTASVMDYLRRLMADPDVEIAIAPGTNLEASPVSDTRSDSYKAIAKSFREVFPDALVAPGLLVGTTDTRHYQMLAENSFRFLPLRLKADDLKRFHGTDERISVSNYAEIIRFYVQLISNTGG